MTTKIKHPRFRVHDWLDTQQMEVRYGVQMQSMYGGRWRHAVRQDGTICITDVRQNAVDLCEKLKEAAE